MTNRPDPVSAPDRPPCPICGWDAHVCFHGGQTRPTSSSITLTEEQMRKVIKKLAEALIVEGWGEHDMFRCRMCDKIGHNLGTDYYGLRHTESCVFSDPLVQSVLTILQKGEKL